MTPPTDITTAGRAATRTILSDLPVLVFAADELAQGPASAMERVAYHERYAFTVKIIALSRGINVACFGEYGYPLDGADGGPSFTIVPYPVPHTDPDFTDQLCAVLRPVAEAALSRVNAARTR